MILWYFVLTNFPLEHRKNWILEAVCTQSLCQQLWATDKRQTPQSNGVPPSVFPAHATSCAIVSDEQRCPLRPSERAFWGHTVCACGRFTRAQGCPGPPHSCCGARARPRSQNVFSCSERSAGHILRNYGYSSDMIHSKSIK